MVAQRGRGRGRARLEHHPEGEHPERARRARSVGQVQRSDGDAVAILQHADPRHGGPREPKIHLREWPHDVMRPLTDSVRTTVEVADFDDCDRGTGVGHVYSYCIQYVISLW